MIAKEDPASTDWPHAVLHTCRHVINPARTLLLLSNTGTGKLQIWCAKAGCPSHHASHAGYAADTVIVHNAV